MGNGQTRTNNSPGISTLSVREEHLRETLGLSDVWAWEYDADKSRIELSEQGWELLGSRTEVFRGFLAILRPEDKFRISIGILRSIRSRRGFVIESLTLRHKSYPELKIQIQGHPIEDSKGSRFRGIVQNISQLRTVGKLSQDDRFRSLFSQSAIGMVYGNVDGTILDVNDKFSEMTGYGRESIIGSSVYRFTHPSDLQLTNVEHRRLRDSDGNQSIMEKRYIHKDGHSFWVQVSISIIAGSDSRQKYFLAQVQDVDERVRAQASIKQNEENFRLLSESLPQIVWMSNPDSRTWYMNQQWSNYTGRPVEESLGLGWLEYLHPDDRPTIINERNEAYTGPAEDGKAWVEIVQRLRMKDGAYRWFLSRAVAVHNDNGEVLHWIGTATDIDAQKRIEQELDEARMLAISASEAKSAFLANMSHEIRTPLGIILGYCELLKRPGISAELQREFLSSMTRNGKELSQLIDNILDLSKLEAEKMDLDARPIVLREEMGSIIEGLRIKAQEKFIDLSVTIHGDVPKTIVTDALRLRQILINLLGNAIKFTDQGRIDVIVKMLGTAEDLAIDIRDTGCGIDAEQIDRLFKPFSQVDATSTRRYGGTGLGLMLSKLIAKALGGDVTLLDTKRGVGSTFRIIINPKLYDVSTEPKLLESVIETPRNLNGISILLAEDALDNQFIFSTFLRAEGAVVDVVENGREAVAKGREANYDLILMDVQMPVMDGYDATRQLRASGFNGPILALSAHALTEDSMKSKLAGCDDHISKPVDFDRLIAAIQQYTRRA